MSDIFWNGSVQNVPQVTETSFTGTWVAGEKPRATIGSSFVELTLGTGGLDPTGLATQMAVGINQSDKTTDLTFETRNIGGWTRGEFRDVIATSSGGTLILTSSTDGTDFQVTFSDDSVSGGLSPASTTQVATGANWFDDAGNWDGGVLPGTSDVAIFANSSVSATRGLQTIATIGGFTRRGTYTGNIGLAKTNTTHNGYSYTEYRNRFLKIKKANNVINIGDGTGSSQGITKINNDASSNPTYYYINDTAPVSRAGLNPVEIISHATTGGADIRVIKGNIDVGERNNDSGVSTSGCGIEHLRVYGGNVRMEGTPIIDPTTELSIFGGVVDSYNHLDQFTTNINLAGGTLNHNVGITQGFTVENGATLNFNSDTAPTTDITVLTNGVCSFDGNQVEKDLTDINIKLHKNSTFSDIRGVAIPSGSYQFVDCSVQDVNLSLSDNIAYLPSGLG